MRKVKRNTAILPFAKNLRRSMTKEEKHLWYDFLCTYPLHFYRQKIIGKYIADFYCAKAKLVVELDGSQHYEESTELKDSIRTFYLEEYGLKVIRFPNNLINRNFKGVCEYIDLLVKERISDNSIPPLPLP